MENASKALIIAGAILISILIIAIGMYIYSQSTGSINGAIGQMSTQEIDAANSQWTNYEGTQTGTQVKALITRLIANANSFQEEPAKVVGLSIVCNGDGSNSYDTSYDSDGGNYDDFIEDLQDAQSNTLARHNYHVTLDYDGTALIRKINITYD